MDESSSRTEAMITMERQQKIHQTTNRSGRVSKVSNLEVTPQYIHPNYRSEPGDGILRRPASRKYCKLFRNQVMARISLRGGITLERMLTSICTEHHVVQSQNLITKGAVTKAIILSGPLTQISEFST
jgi:hypothetical protein